MGQKKGLGVAHHRKRRAVQPLLSLHQRDSRHLRHRCHCRREYPRKIGPMLKMADCVVVTKGDIVSQAERELSRMDEQMQAVRARLRAGERITAEEEK